jgi:hypothetical protein
MKLYNWLLVAFLPLVFASCMDTREELEIKANGSGTLVVKTDLSKMLEMMKGFVSQEDMQKQGMDRAFDTTMLMKDYVDTAKAVPAEKKALLRDGSLHLVMNVKEGIGKFDIKLPFASSDQLQNLYASLNSSTGGLKGMFDGMNKDKQMGGSDSSMGDKGMPQITSVYDITVKDGLYSRKVNQERYDQFAKEMKLEELKSMGSMMGQMNYTLLVKLPRPIKKINNAKAVLSADKKTATLSVELMETFEHPALLALEIEY